MNKLTDNLKTISFFTYTIIFLLTLSFDRSFIGLQVKNIPLGIPLVGGLFLVSIVFLFFNKNILNILSIEGFTRTININKFLVLSFFVSCIYFNSDFTSTYIYKTSSYIWMISSLYLSLIIFNEIFKYQKSLEILSKLLLLLPLVHYLFSTGRYPNFIMKFWLENSDKFQFTKASDIMISAVVVNLLFFKLSKNSKQPLLYLFFSLPLLLPLLLEMSRGSFIAALIFFLLILIKEFRYLIKNWKFSIVLLLVASITMIFSIYRVSGANLSLDDSEVVIDNSISGNISKIAKKNDTRKAFLSFYFENGRFYSHDNTTNWRLDIWQDVLDDLKVKNSLLKGYGYNEIMPIMTDPSAPGRLGRDGLNEHVHSYLFNIIGRGGLLQLFILIIFHLSYIKVWFDKFGNYYLLYFMVPCFFNSFLDITMEGVHFPFIYYSFLGILYKIDEKIYL